MNTSWLNMVTSREILTQSFSPIRQHPFFRLFSILPTRHDVLSGTSTAHKPLVYPTMLLDSSFTPDLDLKN